MPRVTLRKRSGGSARPIKDGRSVVDPFLSTAMPPQRPESKSPPEVFCFASASVDPQLPLTHSCRLESDLQAVSFPAAGPGEFGIAFESSGLHSRVRDCIREFGIASWKCEIGPGEFGIAFESLGLRSRVWDCFREFGTAFESLGLLSRVWDCFRESGIAFDSLGMAFESLGLLSRVWDCFR